MRWTDDRSRRLLLPFFALMLAFGLVACGDENDSAGPESGADVEDVGSEEGTIGEEEDDAAGADLQAEAERFVGQQVTVSAAVSEMVSPSAFRIGEDTQSSILVLSAPAASFSEMGFELDEQMAEDGTIVQVTGTVRRFDIAAFEEEFGIDYDDALFQEFEGQNVIVADRVTTLTGQEVTVAGDVQNVLSTVAFRLAGVSWDVLVLDAQQAAVDEGDFVQVTGTVRQFDIPAIEEEFGTDLDDALYAQFEGDLVLVAQNVQPAQPAAAQPSG